jgi:flagellar hook-basal body complex protein FliE
MPINGADGSSLSLNGYYLRPVLSYKADTIFGGDERLNKMLAGEEAGVSFADMLKAGLNEVNGLQLEADGLANAFAAGETDNIHAVLIAGEKADLALQFATAIRSKLLDAYQELMRMQI